MSNFNETITSVIGSHFKSGGVVFTVAGADKKEGTMKNSDKANYVMFVGEDGSSKSIHPESAKKILKGKDSNWVAYTAPSLKPKSVTSHQRGRPIAPNSNKQAVTLMFKSGTPRKEAKVKSLALGVSEQGFATYWQNCRSGQWK